jgi:hypothetical protein
MSADDLKAMSACPLAAYSWSAKIAAPPFVADWAVITIGLSYVRFR